MFNKKMKAVTFSYDDGVKQDERLIEIFDKYHLKATFNLNSELLGLTAKLKVDGVEVNHSKNEPGEIGKIYKNHEIAVHTLTHPNLVQLSDEEVVRQIEVDRINLEQLSGKDVVGMAYPCGGINFNQHIVDLIKRKTNIRYARTTISSHKFELQENLLAFKPTVYPHREWDMLFELGKQFLELDARVPKLFYIWGHSYEFDVHNTWDEFEKFCKLISGKNDIFYGTNSEAFFRLDGYITNLSKFYSAQ